MMNQMNMMNNQNNMMDQNMMQQQMMQQQMMQQQMMQQQMMQQQMMQQQMVQQQMQNVLNNSNSNVNQNQTQSQSQPQNQSTNKPGGKCVIFRKSGEGQQGPPIMIQCMDGDKISEVIQRYRTKANDTDDSKKFIFNAKQLNTTLTVGEAGITDNANIFVVTTRGVKGAY